MGTRGFVGFVVDENVKVTYNHFDSYPSWLGVQVLDWLRTAVRDEPRLAEQARRLVLVDEGTKPTPEQQKELAQYADLTVGGQDIEDWYCLLRETQGDPQKILDCGFMIDSSEFPLDSLFCEWGYLVDLDNRVLEVYCGFTKAPPKAGRWAGRPTPAEYAADYAAHVEWCKENDRVPWMPANAPEYYAVKRIASWSFDELPDNDTMLNLEKEN